MITDPDELKRQFPEYLTSDKKEKLAAALEAFESSSSPIYTTKEDDGLLQGDIWSGLEILDFDSGSRKWIKGMILSNSCDVSSENKRHAPPNIVVAPIVKLESLRTLFLRHGISDEAVGSKIAAIERQAVTSIFYLPSAFCLPEAHVVLLDNVHSVPLAAFDKRESKSRMFSLNLLGFYLLIFKLSVHFCRMHENVDRPIGSHG